MANIVLYHGTSANNAKQIKREGFVLGKSYNWDVKSKTGFVYLSLAYAPFFAMYSTNKSNKLALIKCRVNSKDCYPEDDFIMCALGKPKYTQAELDAVDLEDYKPFWENSLAYMGNIAVKPNKVKVAGVRFFDGKNLILKCDPVISPMNFKIMGNYYKRLTAWLYEGNKVEDFNHSIF